MKIFNIALLFAAVSFTYADDENMDLAPLCGLCDYCEKDDNCQVNLIKQIACGTDNGEENCETLDFTGALCGMCDVCDAMDVACDSKKLLDFACGTCLDTLEAVAEALPFNCFAGHDMVDVLGQGPTKMKNLNVGDSVLTSEGYENVYSFAHKMDNGKATNFLKIEHQAGKALEVTEEHLVFVHGKNYVAAKDVQVGDVLKGVDADSVVTGIKNVMRLGGIYAPLVNSGKLIVNGVEASSYVYVDSKFVSDHDMVHMSLSPFRMYCNTFGCEAEEMPAYVEYGLKALDMAGPVAFAVLFALASASYLVEQTMDLPTLAFVVGAFVYYKSTKKAAKGLKTV
jgi:hypothetical protein